MFCSDRRGTRHGSRAGKHFAERGQHDLAKLLPTNGSGQMILGIFAVWRVTKGRLVRLMLTKLYLETEFSKQWLLGVSLSSSLFWTCAAALD